MGLARDVVKIVSLLCGGAALAWVVSGLARGMGRMVYGRDPGARG